MLQSGHKYDEIHNGIFIYVQGEYRAAMAKEWLGCFKELDVPHTEEPNLISTLGDPVKIRSWQVRTKLSSADLKKKNTACL